MIDRLDGAAAGSEPSGQQLGFLLFLCSSFLTHPSIIPCAFLSQLIFLLLLHFLPVCSVPSLFFYNWTAVTLLKYNLPTKHFLGH